jgi:hypothetical protein
MTLAFLFVGPVPFLQFVPTSTGLIQTSAASLSSGYAMIMVSTFGRAQSAAIRNGFEDDLNTYMFISSKIIHRMKGPNSYHINKTILIHQLRMV